MYVCKTQNHKYFIAAFEILSTHGTALAMLKKSQIKGLNFLEYLPFFPLDEARMEYITKFINLNKILISEDDQLSILTILANAQNLRPDLRENLINVFKKYVPPAEEEGLQEIHRQPQ